MRIGVARLDFLLRVAQFRAQIHPVVVVGRAMGKERAERPEELRQLILAAVQPHRQALIEIARRRVERTVERPLMPLQAHRRSPGRSGY